LADKPMISLVLFDLDDTLFAHRRAVEDGIVAYTHSLGGALGVLDTIAIPAHWNELEEVHYHRYLHGELDYVGQRRARVRGFLEPYGLTIEDDAEADRWFDAYFVEYQRAWKLHDDALPALAALSHLRLGLITNGDRAFQTHKIQSLGLASFFEHVVTSGELGFAKPDPRIFEYAASAFGVEPHAALYVGDRLRTDAIGAADAGLTGVWLDRRGAASADDREAARTSGVHVISTLSELPDIARQIG
jgi:putative hydrolase of the HAD superfamily